MPTSFRRFEMPNRPIPHPTQPERTQSGLLAIVFIAAIILLALAANALVALSASAAERQSVRGADVAIFNLAGTISVVAGTSPSVDVDITRGGRDGGDLKIETGLVRSKQTLRIVYPSHRVIYPELGRGSNVSLSVRDDGTFADEHGINWPDRERVRISGSGSGLEAWADLTVRIPRGQKIAVYLAAGKLTAQNVDGRIRLDGAAATLASSGTRGSLTMDTGSGDVAVSDAEGDVNVDTGSGDVSLTNVRATDLIVDTGSGEIRGRGLSAPHVSLDTGSGSVQVSKVDTQDLKVDTGSGDVEVELTANTEGISVDTGSGTVVIHVPQSYGAEVSLETGSGDINTDIPIQIRRKDGDSLRGTIGDGRGRMTVETGSGDIRIASLR
jgi:hypothetical protein